MSEEEVSSPDQHKPDNLKVWRAFWVLAILLMLAMLIGNQRGRVEDVWLVAVAATIAVGLIADIALRRKGIKR